MLGLAQIPQIRKLEGSETRTDIPAWPGGKRLRIHFSDFRLRQEVNLARFGQTPAPPWPMTRCGLYECYVEQTTQTHFMLSAIPNIRNVKVPQELDVDKDKWAFVACQPAPRYVLLFPLRTWRCHSVPSRSWTSTVVCRPFFP